MQQAIIIFLQLTVTALIYWLLNKFIPAKKNVFQTELSIEELRKKYGKKYILLTVLYLPFMLLCFGIAAYVITSLTSLVYDKLNLLANYLEPCKQTWYFLIFTIGLDLCGILSPYFYKLFTRKNFDEFLIFANSLYGIDNLKFWSLLSKICRSVSIAYIIFNLNNVAKFSNDNITISRFLELKRNYYSYDDIKSIISYNKSVAPNGRITNNKKLVIYFKNDDCWKTNTTNDFQFNKDSMFFANKIIPNTNLSIQKEELYK